MIAFLLAIAVIFLLSLIIFSGFCTYEYFQEKTTIKDHHSLLISLDTFLTVADTDNITTDEEAIWSWKNIPWIVLADDMRFHYQFKYREYELKYDIQRVKNSYYYHLNFKDSLKLERMLNRREKQKITETHLQEQLAAANNLSQILSNSLLEEEKKRGF